MATYAIFKNDFFLTKPAWMPKKLFTVVNQRANPKSLDHMTNLLKSKNIDAAISELREIPLGSEVILLYPDAIGIGFNKVETECLSKFSKVIVLNGRGRMFPLDTSIRTKLIFKRFLEVTFLPELLLSPFLILTGLILAITDKIKGHS